MWTKEKPVRGYYWFYGKKNAGIKSTLTLVRVNAGNAFYTSGGGFCFNLDDSDGYWSEVVKPELPSFVLEGGNT